MTEGRGWRNFSDVLCDFDVDTLEQLSEAVDDHAEWDAWVAPLEEQEGLPEMLLVGVMNRGTCLRFPFTQEDPWECIDELEDEIEAAHEE